VARIDWCGSNSVRVKVRQGVTYDLEVGSNLRGWRLLVAIVYVTVLHSEYLYLRPA
jgi:hypothetical protein